MEELAQFSEQNCIIICDRGSMDGSAREYTVCTVDVSIAVNTN